MTTCNFDPRRIVVALDFSTADEARTLLQQLNPQHCRVKIGKELFTSAGPAFVKEVIGMGFDVFLDLKFHDIPNTVAKAVAAAAALGVWMVNVHASGGSEMMKAARAAVANSQHKPLLIAVTVLTSLSQSDLVELGIAITPAQQVLRLATLAQQSGMDGVVCSAAETAMLRAHLGDAFCLVTPGIRTEGDDANDQKRIVTPVDAILAGSHYLVIGRPITKAADPGRKLELISEQLHGSFSNLC
jgi:orotidine-5'-phosphate decarboxylase